MVSEYVLIGVGFGFAAAVQPGPLQAFLLSATLAHGWKRTLPAAFAPLLSDGPIVALVLLVLRQVPAGFERGIRMAGGLLLVYLATGAFKQWRRHAPVAGEIEAPRTLLRAAVLNILNPNPYLAWSLVLGPLLLRAWRQGALAAVGMVSAFYGTMVAVIAGTVILFGTVRALGARVSRALLLVSAGALLALGAYQLWIGIAA